MLTNVLELSEAKLGSRLVMIAIADTARDDGVAWDSFKTIGVKTRMDPDSVRRCVKDLVAAHELQMVKARWGRSTINVYRISVGELASIDWKRIPTEITKAVREGLIQPCDLPTSDLKVHADSPSESPVPSVAQNKFPLKEVVLNRTGTVKEREPNGSLVEEVPKLKVVEGQNLPLNALASECNLSLNGGNKGKLAVALNGKRGESIPGIREQYWNELALWAEGNEERAAQVAAARGEKFERWLAAKVLERAALYRAKMTVPLTPLGLRTHWTDLPAMEERTVRGGRPSILDTPNTFPGWGDE